MKIKLLLLVAVLYACGTKTVSEEETYDRITVTTYENKYDEKNRLSEVQWTRTSRMYEKDAETMEVTENKSTDYYTYTNNEKIYRRKKIEDVGQY